VDGVSFALRENEVVGLVGESGCGKTTVGRTILRLYDPTGGEIWYRREDGERVEVSSITQKEMKPLRQEMRMIFQDPFSSLNPRFTVKDIISEPLIIHGIAKGKAVEDRVAELMREVGLDPNYMQRYPHEFSGGQRQRIGIARALALNPDLIICDEPISSLDVSIQAQVVNLLEELQERLGLTYLFIAHDLSMVRHISDRMAVMYLGKIMEIADRDEIYLDPLHPYTQALMSAVPIPDPEIADERRRIILEGDIPNPSDPPKGCNFNTRCPVAEEVCFAEEPPFLEAKADHWTACHLVKTEHIVSY
jgi:oligopeptide/dipeptide ABC transporter ATP-binding protein